MTPPSIALLFLAAALLVACGSAGRVGMFDWLKSPEKSSTNITAKQTTKTVDSTTVVPTTLKSRGNSGKLIKSTKSTTTTPKPPEVQPINNIADVKERNQPSPLLNTSEDQEQSTAIPIPIIFYSDGGYGDYNPLAPNAYQSPYGNYFPPQPFNPYALWKMNPWAEQPLADLSASVPWSPSFQRPVRSLYPPAPLYPWYYPPPLPPQNSPCSHSSHTSENNNLNAEEKIHSHHQRHDHHHTTTTTEKPDGPDPTRISLTQPTQSESVSNDQQAYYVQYNPYNQNYDNPNYPQYASVQQAVYGYPQYAAVQQPAYGYPQYSNNNYYQKNQAQPIGTVQNKEKRHGHHKRHHKHHSQ